MKENYKVESMGYSEGYGSSRYNVYSVHWFDGKKWRMCGGYPKHKTDYIVEYDLGKSEYQSTQFGLWFFFVGVPIAAVIAIILASL